MQHSCLWPQSSPIAQVQVSPNCTVAGQGLTGLCAKASMLFAREWRRGVISMLGPLACLHAKALGSLGQDLMGLSMKLHICNSLSLTKQQSLRWIEEGRAAPSVLHILP